MTTLFISSRPCKVIALKFRIGDYRALLDIDRERKIVKVQVLDHRSRIYKR